MKKWVCTVCGYVYEGENAPEFCPVCKAPASKFKEKPGFKKVFAKIPFLISFRGSSKQLIIFRNFKMPSHLIHVIWYNLLHLI